MSENSPARVISRRELDDARYFESLIETALARGVISEESVRDIRLSLVSALADKCRRYTQGDSSSVPVETAAELMKSMAFTLGVWLKREPEPQEALYALARQGVTAGLDKGLKALRTTTEAMKTFYAMVKAKRAPTDNYAYNSTLDGGIAGFFRLYEPEFGAHRIHITADYPLALYPDGLLGIEFITAYLQRLQYENLFMSAFPERAVRRLIALYAIALNETTKDMVCGLFEIVLAGAIACELAGESAQALALTPYGAASAAEAMKRADFSLARALRGVLRATGRETGGVARYAESVCDVDRVGVMRAIGLLADVLG